MAASANVTLGGRTRLKGFKVPGQPALEAALNRLATEINSIPDVQFEGGQGLDVTEHNGKIVVALRNGARGWRPRYEPTFVDGKLRIGLGTVGLHADGNGAGGVVEPYFPRFEGKVLNHAIPPELPVEQIDDGDNKIILRCCLYDSRIEVVSAEEDMDKDVGEWIITLATFTKEGAKISDLRHLFTSDVLILDASESCDIEGSDDPDPSDDSDGDDSDDSDEPPPSDSDESDDSDDSSGSGDGCCPEIALDATVVSPASPFCFSSGDSPYPYWVAGSVSISKASTCDGCEEKPVSVHVQVGDASTSANLFPGGPPFTFLLHPSFGSPCATVPVTATIASLTSVAGTCPCFATKSVDITLPGLEPDCECSDDSSGSSDDSDGGELLMMAPPGEMMLMTEGSDDSALDDKEAVVESSLFPTGYAAMRCVESPETWFTDTFRVEITGRVTLHRIDAMFADVCDPGTIRVVSAVPDLPRPVGCVAREFPPMHWSVLLNRMVPSSEEGAHVVVRCGWFLRPRSVMVTVAGIRKGRSGQRFVPRSKEEFDRSQAFWSQLKDR